MKSFSIVAAGVIAFGLVSSPALASSPRTFVSGAGSDSGGCGLTAPCRTFAYAIQQTSASGEIIVLNSAGYGPVTITQPVSIINTGNFAGVTVASGNGITINAGSSDSVTLVGLTIDGGATVSNGIVFNSGAKLIIDQCNLVNFAGSGATGNGALIQPASGNPNITITNTTASNTNMGINYLPISGSTASAGIVIDRVAANNNLYGLNINNGPSSGVAKAGVSNSIASLNGYGISLQNATVSLDGINATGNGNSGVNIFSGTLAIGRSVLMNNGLFGLDFLPGTTVNSYKDNRIEGNGVGAVTGSPNMATLY